MASRLPRCNTLNLAAGAVRKNRLVKVTGGQNADECNADDTIFGVSEQDAETGGEFETTYQGGAFLTAGGNVPAGSIVKADAQGRGIVGTKAADGNKVLSITAAAAAGDLMEVHVS